MPPLPDVDATSYNEYQADQFGQQTDRRIGALGFSAAADARIASLNDMYAPPPQPQPASVDQNLPEAQPAPVASETPGMAPYVGAISPPVSRPPVPAASPSFPAQSGGTDLVAEAMNAADRHGIDPQLFVSQIQQESGFNPNAGSPAGARGIAQIVPKFHPGVDTSDPVASLDYAANLMASHLKTYNGDVTKALAAYNAGPGAVEKFGGVPPYEETQRYVDNILSRMSAEATTNPAGGYAPGPTEGLRRVGQGIGDQPVQDISQFGDSQLSADEAYAACGPAAAVRFAQRFGRNPTLKEALDLAKTVGWTSQQGMAGLGSEKSLMDKLGVPTKLVQGADWATFSREAQTGNPVTISTAGHYFTADGYNPDTGAFHVGRSGLDLKGGREWMTPQQMTALMGSVQGGLLADNPQVAAPSTADQDSNPLSWLGRQKDALVSSITGAVSDAGQMARSAISDAGQGITSMFAQPAGMPASMQPTPSDTLTNPTMQQNPTTPPVTPSNTPPASDTFGQTASNVGTAVGQVASDLANATPPGSMLRGGLNLANAAVPATDSSASTMPTGGQLIGSYERGRVAEDQRAQDLLDKQRTGTITPVDAQWLNDYMQNTALAVAGEDVRLPKDFNPFALHIDPAPGRVPLSHEEIASHVEDLSSRYEANDARIQQLENQLSGGSLAAGASGVQRPPWGVGWTNDALRQVAQQHNVNPYEPLWWEKANLVAGSGELRENVGQGGLRGTGSTQQTPAQARAEMARLVAENEQILAATEVPEGATTLYRPTPQTSADLPFEPYNPANVPGATATIEPAANATGTYPSSAAANPAAAPVSAGTAPAVRAGAPATAPAPVAPQPGRYQSVMPAGTFEPAAAIARPSTPSQTLESVTGWITQHFTDRDVTLSRIQQEYQRALGRPLNADEMAYELKRLAPDPAAAQKIDEGLKPAIQSVGDDYAALRDYVTLRSNVQVADALGNDARAFSGGLTKADSQQRLAQLEAQLGSDRFQTVQTAADQVSQFSKDLRRRLIDSGVLNPLQAAQMDAKYPDWAKTRILDYMKDPAGGQAAGTKIGLADRNLRSYTLEGTTKAREDPLASTVAYAHQVERMAMKNETFNALRTIDQASPNPMLRKVSQDFTPTKNQVTIVGFENGQKVKYVTDNKALGEAINGTSILPVPEWTKAWGQIFRSFATSRNPLFLAGNAALDIPTYVIRESVRAGGPQHLPQILGELAKGYVDAFGGLLKGEYRGNTARFIEAGGGSGSYASASEQQAAQSITDLQRRNVFQISGKADVLRLVKDLVTLQPVESIGQRIEYGPRTASFRLAEQRGQNPVQAVINGRTVTVDFSQGGDVTKYINNFIPFFNVGFQGPAQVARAFHENPGAFAWTTGALLGAPAIAAEAWNRSDSQRAQDYKDVPQYVKDQGVVVMLPGDAPIDAQGNRKPLYAVLKLREWAPFASLARDAAARVVGDDTKSWQDIAGSAAKGFAPTNASSVGQLGTEALSGIPVLPAAAQIQYNTDFFRNRNIVTTRADTNASAAAKSLTPAIQAVVDRFGLNAEVRPSAVDFFIRNQGAGVGGAALGASDIAAGKARQDTSPTSLPGVGGLIGRFAGNQTGQGMQTARDEGLTQSARQILRQNGITSTPGPASSSVNQIPLKLDEETRYQQLTNRYVDDAIHRVVQTPEWATMTQQGKDLVMQRTIDAARKRAGAETLSSIPEQERLRRLQTKSTAPSVPAVGAPTR